MKFLADENFNNRILRGLLRQMPSIDLLRVQDLMIAGKDDETVLEWAASEGLILLTHDRRTVPYYALQRMMRGAEVAGVIVVPDHLAHGVAIDNLLVIASCSTAEEWRGRIEYLPYIGYRQAPENLS